jgi:hypothetical protein
MWFTAIAALASVGVVRAEMVNVVEISDLQKKITYEVKTAQEFRELKKQYDAEQRVFQKALDLTKKEWEQGDKGAPPAEKPKPGEKIERPPPPPPFPSGMLAARRCTDKGFFSDRDKAQKRVEQLDTAAMDAITKAAERNKGKTSDKDKKKQALENERALAADRAATALDAKIQELLKSPAGAAPAAPAAGGAAAPAPAAAPAAK